MTDMKKKVNNSNPQEGVLRFSDDDSMSIQDADISDSEHDLLIRLSQQAQHRRASQNQYHNDINVIGDDSHNDTTASLDLEVVSNEHDIEDHLMMKLSKKTTMTTITVTTMIIHTIIVTILKILIL